MEWHRIAVKQLLSLSDYQHDNQETRSADNGSVSTTGDKFNKEHITRSTFYSQICNIIVSHSTNKMLQNRQDNYSGLVINNQII